MIQRVEDDSDVAMYSVLYVTESGNKSRSKNSKTPSSSSSSSSSLSPSSSSIIIIHHHQPSGLVGVILNETSFYNESGVSQGLSSWSCGLHFWYAYLSLTLISSIMIIIGKRVVNQSIVSDDYEEEEEEDDDDDNTWWEWGWLKLVNILKMSRELPSTYPLFHLIIYLFTHLSIDHHTHPSINTFIHLPHPLIYDYELSKTL